MTKLTFIAIAFSISLIAGAVVVRAYQESHRTPIQWCEYVEEIQWCAIPEITG